MHASATSTAPGKVILAGEHFAVYRRPAIALPLESVSTTVEVRPGPHDLLVTQLEPGDHARAFALVRLARSRVPGWADQPVEVRVAGSVPVGMGLGSSAAFAVALTRALAVAAGHDWDAEAVRTVAHELECQVHGSPSGLDDTVIAHATPVLFRRGEPPRPLRAGGPLHFVLGSVGYAGSTYEAVAGVRRLAEARPDWFAGVLDQAEREVTAVVEAFEAGDAAALGPHLDAVHALLADSQVSCPDLERLVTAARDAGALGAKLVGAGCGGFMLALTDGPRQSVVADALRRAGAEPVFVLSIKGPNP